MLNGALALVATAVAAGPAEFITVQSATLTDGLQVVAVQQPDAKKVTLVVAIDGGRAGEPAPGLARTAAESWFKGAATPVRTVEQVYDRIGATTSVAVLPESTVFTTQVPLDKVGEALTLEWRRFSAPLDDIDELAPVTREASVEAYRAQYLDAVYQALYTEGHAYGDLYTNPVADHPVYLASSWVTASWRPDQSTLVVLGPESPDSVLCGLEPSACPVATPQQVEAPFELPKSTLRVSGARVKGQTIGPLQVGVPSTLLLSWALPGLDAVGEQIVSLVRDRIQAELRGELPAARCLMLEPGREATTLVCVLPADVDRETLEKAFRKGWSTRRLAKDVEEWREEAMGRLLGTSVEADFGERLALHVRRGGEPTPYAGALADLAFDDGAVRNLLTGAAAFEAATWVRLEP